MSLLEKCNPYATWQSVVLAAVVQMLRGLPLFLLYFKPEFRQHWQITLPLWLLLCGFVGAVMEWQNPPDGDDELVPPEDGEVSTESPGEYPT